MASSLPPDIDDCLYCIYDWKRKYEEADPKPRNKEELNRLWGEHMRRCRERAAIKVRQELQHTWGLG